MTIDETSCRATDSLILPTRRAFFPIKIPNQHPQLRHYISTSDPDVVYFVTGYDVCSLRLSTRKGNLITSLPFEPRCLAAGYGWICLGGPDSGACAFIRIGEQGQNGQENTSISSPAEVDALLPLDLDPMPRRHFDRPLAQPPQPPSPPPRRKPDVYLHELGGQIVNSVTIFRMPGDDKNVGKEDLCLLSNNDCTVKIYSLTQSRLLETLDHPIPMNYALISPSGHMMAAVGDENRAYFYKRIKLPAMTSSGDKSLAMYQWKLISTSELPVPPDPPTDQNACFTIAFSPSSHLCAIASQEGLITIFDANLLQTFEDGEDAMICSFRSSRNTQAGAVRSMSFSPEPWDLLAWAEDRGRICIADTREHFRRRQTVELNVNATNLERRDISDLLSPETEFNAETRAIREALDAGDDDLNTHMMIDYVEAAQRRRQRRQARALAQGVREASPHGLTERERQILSALRTARQRPNEDSNITYSINYQTPIGHPSRASAAHDTDEPRLATLSSLGTIREFIRERNSERNRAAERSGDRAYQPRRRSSVVLSQGNNSGSSSANHSTSNLAPTRPGATVASTLTVSPARLLSPGDTTSTNGTSSASQDPWQTIEAALQGGPGSTQTDPVTRLRREREAAVEASFERREQIAARLGERYARMRQPTDRLDRLGIIEDTGYVYRTYEDPEAGVGTAGVGWSEDGRMLYIGTEEGIFEFHVNSQERRTFPDFSFR